MIAHLTASMDQTGSQAASLLEPGRGFMASAEATGAEVITGAVGIMGAASTADAVALAADAVALAADVAASAADAVALAADVAASAADAVAAGSTAAAVAVPMAVGMVGATDN
jgi:hypothetical protein